MLLNELLKAIQPVQVTGDSKIEITGVNIDSRLVEAGQLFMAMRGTQTDGHAYMPPFRRERLPSSAKIYRRNP